MNKPLLVVFVFAVIAAVAVFCGPKNVMPLKDYNVILLNDGVKLTVKGTHIKTTNGFCTEIWKGDTLDTVVCAPHLLTEVEETGQAPLNQGGNTTVS